MTTESAADNHHELPPERGRREGGPSGLERAREIRVAAEERGQEPSGEPGERGDRGTHEEDARIERDLRGEKGDRLIELEAAKPGNDQLRRANAQRCADADDDEALKKEHAQHTSLAGAERLPNGELLAALETPREEERREV